MVGDELLLLLLFLLLLLLTSYKHRPSNMHCVRRTFGSHPQP